MPATQPGRRRGRFLRDRLPLPARGSRSLNTGRGWPGPRGRGAGGRPGAVGQHRELWPGHPRAPWDPGPATWSLGSLQPPPLWKGGGVTCHGAAWPHPSPPPWRPGRSAAAREGRFLRSSGSGRCPRSTRTARGGGTRGAGKRWDSARDTLATAGARAPSGAGSSASRWGAR